MICTEASLNPKSIMRAKTAAISMFYWALIVAEQHINPEILWYLPLLIEPENYNKMEILDHLYIMSKQGEQNDFFDKTIDIKKKAHTKFLNMLAFTKKEKVRLFKRTKQTYPIL